MAFARVQGNITEDNAGATTIAVTISAVGSGNLVCGWVGWDNSAGVTLSSVGDDKGNTYNLETQILDTSNNQKSCAFSRTNITNAPVTITATFSASTDFRKIIVDEFSGGSTASNDERDGAAHGGQFESAPGTGTDAVDSGTFTTSTNGDLLYGACMGAAAGAICSVGTSFSSGTSGTNGFTGQTEFRTQATAGAGTAATFTHAVDTQRVTHLIAIKPSGGAAASPFNQEDWPLPKVAPFPTSLRSWTWSYNRNLIALDVMPAGRKGITFDPPPDRPPPAGPTWTWQYNLNLVGKDAFPPGRKGAVFDVPPEGYPPPGKTWTWQYNLSLVGKDQLPPGKNYTERPQPVSWQRGWTQNLLLSTLSVVQALPFNQYDWLLPERALQPDRTWTQSFNLNLIGQDQLPVGVVSNRILMQPAWYRDWSQNLLLSTLAPAPALPLNQYNWPLPRGYEYPVDLRTWVNGAIQTIADQLPFNQYDWPTSQRVPVAGRTWVQNLLLSTLSTPQPMPLNQYDWPLPQRAIQPNRSFTVSQNLNLISQDQLPIRQMDWPVPRGYYYPLSVKDVSGLNLNLFPPPPPPVVTGELRNPPFIGTSTGQMMTWGRW